MKTRLTMQVAGLALVLAGCGAATQHESTTVAGTRCANLPNLDREVAELLDARNILAAEPSYHQLMQYSEPLKLYVSGAKLYVPAARDMNQAYLQRALSCYASSDQGLAAQPNDPLRVAAVRDVSVQPAGQSFEIAITGVDRQAGEAIWQSARALRDSSTHVRVEQLSQASAAHGAF